MPRAITTIPAEWSRAIDKRIADLRRPSESNYIACLIEDDLRASGHLSVRAPDPHAELLTLAEELGHEAAVAALREQIRLGTAAPATRAA